MNVKAIARPAAEGQGENHDVYAADEGREEGPLEMPKRGWTPAGR